MNPLRRSTDTTKITPSMREWCRVLSGGGYIKGWRGCTIGCSAGNGHGVAVRITFVMVEKLVKSGLIDWEEYQVEGISLWRTRAVLTEAGHREAAAK